uniref:Uncharacterized protein n=1 Tax=Tanacetum cinerariifolium TaxID=118510 RepID=A0A699JMZ8_TANCI|nr:hypothetical protein [Tanacetum cinerariifolium]
MFPEEKLMSISDQGNEPWTLKSGAIELHDKDGNEFIVNRQRVKPYNNDSKNFDSDDDIILENHGGVTQGIGLRV